MSETLSYKEAALSIGCTHHYVRMLVAKNKLQIAERIEVRPNVLKVFLTKESIEAYKESRRRRYTKKFKLTIEEEKAVNQFLKEMRNGSDR